jgi:hypothetical protein
MKKFLLIIFLILSVSLLSTSLFSEEPNQHDYRIFGTVYVRPNIDDRDFSNLTHPLYYTVQRISIGIEKELTPDITILAEAMDSRVWGQEQNVRKSIANIDLHQGFLKMQNIFNVPIDLKIGRFELEYNKKVIGPSNWQDVPRAFDGFDITLRTSPDLVFDFFTLQVVNSTNYISTVVPGNYAYPANPDQAYYAPGLTFKYKFDKDFFLQPIVLYEASGKSTNYAEFSKTTAAIDLIYKIKRWDMWYHIGYQTGKTGSKDLSAYGGHAFIGYSFGFVKPMIVLDINSGTKPSEQSTKDNLYFNNFGNKHIFWGNADYFGNLSTETAGLGLNQYGLKLFFNENKPLSFLLEADYFTTNVENLNNKLDLGEEIDLIFKYTFNKKMFIDWGLTAFLPGEVMKNIYAISNEIKREDVGFYSYLRFMFNF